MTAHYRLDVDARQVADMFGADAGRDPWAGGYVTPGRPAPLVLRGKDGGRYLAPRIWGVPPHQSFSSGITDSGRYRPVTTVRNTQSPFWIGNLRHTEFRCLVPATAFQIWSAAADPRTGRKRPYWFYAPAQPVMAFAGIWRDSEVASFALLTTEPNDRIAAINPAAMPVILAPEDQELWLTADWNSAESLVRPYPASMMECLDQGGG
ncbi:SOS response-associated peptidase [Sphingorhabdus arenilitoris]|uniref:Abasic site processing protein n=1 Tax=Sphingorhabdus arenilitoris TaxID=1490041 RepID=A0ABV8RH45_9SPHN